MMAAVGKTVLVEPITERQLLAKQVKSGILLKEHGFQGVPKLGKVLSIGDKINNPEYKIGDTVIFNEPQPQGFKEDGRDYLPIEANKIMGIVNES